MNNTVYKHHSRIAVSKVVKEKKKFRKHLANILQIFVRPDTATFSDSCLDHSSLVSGLYFIYIFIHSFIHSFTHSLIYFFIYLFIYLQKEDFVPALKVRVLGNVAKNKNNDNNVERHQSKCTICDWKCFS